MGYFKQPVRRGRAREEVRRTFHATTRLRGRPVYATRERREVLLRFAAGPVHPDSHHQSGIFHTGDFANVFAHPELSDAQRGVLDDSCRWFNENLVAPHLNEPRAIFWFRAEAAGACVTRIWDRVALLRQHGIVVRMLRCNDPGLIIYRDDHQVAAIPQRRPRWRFRAL